MLPLRFRLVFLCVSCVWMVFLHCGFTVVLLIVRLVFLCFACNRLVCCALFAVFFAMFFLWFCMIDTTRTRPPQSHSEKSPPQPCAPLPMIPQNSWLLSIDATPSFSLSFSVFFLCLSGFLPFGFALCCGFVWCFSLWLCCLFLLLLHYCTTSLLL